MLYLKMVDGSPRRIPEAETGQIEGGQLVCRNGDGLIVAIFDAPLVSAFSDDDALAKDTSIRLSRRALQT